MRILPLLALVALAAGCASPGSGTFTLQVTDAPDDIGDFTTLNVTVDKIVLKPKEGSQLERTASSSTFDLTKLTSGNVTTLFSGAVPVGNYTKLDIVISSATGTLAANGSSVAVSVPSGRIFLNTAFEVAEGKETTFLFDVQVHQEGNGDYALKPNADGSGPKTK